MFRSGFILTTRAHLEAAMHNKSNVNVWQKGRIIEYGGAIESLSDDAVKINGDYFLLEACEFRIR